MNARIRVGMSTCGLAAGAEATMQAIRGYAAENSSPVVVQRTGCLGACYAEPLVEVISDDGVFLYGSVNAAAAESIMAHHFSGAPANDSRRYLISGKSDRSDFPYLGIQQKISTQLCGVIDPGSLDDYLAHEGYQAFRKAIEMTPDEVIQTIKDSRLRGRGGAGFPTGLKWELSRKQVADPKYLICNADEGDPGAFMNRTMIEGDPHRVLEGMLIAAYAIGACKGYIYIRAEYPLAVSTLKNAIAQMQAAGLTGKDILGCGWDFEFIIKEGAGAFVCGEETALMHSIEGKRGMPRMRPPYPSESGLWGFPSNVNNVETFANVPSILLYGADWYAGIGTQESGGTKAFALTGAVRNSGLAEVPLGMTLQELLLEVGGGAREGRTLKAVQIGGPSGGCIPADMFETPIDYRNISATGAIMGSGGMVVVDNTTCMVDFARYFLTFTQHESCGKCVPCRVGTRKMLNILTRITRGEGTHQDLEQLQRLCASVRDASLCGLGTSAPNPALTTMKYFGEEYRAHVEDKTCPAGVCRMEKARAAAGAGVAA